MHPEQSGTVNARRQSHFGFTRNPVVLTGGTLTSIFFVTAGPSAGGKRVISVHCWVLREHAMCFVSDDACQSFRRSVG
ncbi:hypothetical protein JOJ87_004861 [Rhodococcus ruber]|nr:hypothetical protein [Rhodococcus ruber]MBP2214517.1 hypothetical protein [Rhodococcus ruber]